MHPQRNRLLRDRHDGRARANVNLVSPLAAAGAATDMRTTDTRAQPDLFGAASGSGAACGLIAAGVVPLRPAGVDCEKERFCPPTPATPGIRTSTTATRTTTTRTTTSGRAPSADRPAADFSYPLLFDAWLDCRRTKRNTTAALAWELDLEANLDRLYQRLANGTYQPGRSIVFAIRHPKPREVWAAPFEDRVVHHLLYRKIGPRFERAFIADSCACIEGRGTLYAARRLEAKVRAVTANWSRPAAYLKCDLASFFVSIDKQLLAERLHARIPEPWWRDLADTILFNDPRAGADVRGTREDLARIPAHKSLFAQTAHRGLPIGNLSSQFFANVVLDELDQYAKHQLKVRHYIRYVDDFLLLHEDPQQLNAWHDAIAAFLPARLHLRLNDSKTIRQPIDRGVDFVGQVIKPWRRTLRRTTLNAALARIEHAPDDKLQRSACSYLGLARQATHSHRDRARLANAARRRGFSVDRQLTKVYT